MATFPDLTTAQLKQAIRIREQIELLQPQLSALLGGTAPRAKPNDPAAKHTPPAAGQTKTDAAPNWRLAHVRSPLDTLMRQHQGRRVVSPQRDEPNGRQR